MDTKQGRVENLKTNQVADRFFSGAWLTGYKVLKLNVSNARKYIRFLVWINNAGYILRCHTPYFPHKEFCLIFCRIFDTKCLRVRIMYFFTIGCASFYGDFIFKLKEKTSLCVCHPYFDFNLLATSSFHAKKRKHFFRKFEKNIIDNLKTYKPKADTKRLH